MRKLATLQPISQTGPTPTDEEQLVARVIRSLAAGQSPAQIAAELRAERIHQEPPRDVMALPDKAMFSQAEAAAILGVSRPTLSAALQAGTFRSLRLGRRVIVPRAALADWIAGQDRR